MEICAKINTMQNINILLFIRSLSSASLKLAVKHGRPVDHQASTQ